MGLRAVEELKSICPQEISMAQFALRWILMFDGVTSAIPGAKYPFQVEENISASDLPPLQEKTMVLVRKLYESHIREYVHQYW
jgi:aryl-alcohol dehydrogenase-like predicted oxidoreductase